jgi:hypothetical protein
MTRFLSPARLALASGGVMALLLIESGSALAVTQVGQAPTEMQFTNPCNGDFVDVTGTVHFMQTVAGPGKSGESESRFVLGGLQGTGTSGDSYIFNGEGAFMSAGVPGTVVVVMLTTVTHLISQGPDQNFQTMFTMQLVFDGQGNLIEAHGTGTESCNG